MITTRLIGALVEEDIVRRYAIPAGNFELDLLAILVDGDIEGNNLHQDFIGVLVEELVYRAFADRNGFIHVNQLLQLRLLDMAGDPILDQNGLPIIQQ